MKGMPVEEILLYALLGLFMVVLAVMVVVAVVALWPHEEPTRVPDAPVFASVTRTLSGTPDGTGPAQEGKEEKR